MIEELEKAKEELRNDIASALHDFRAKVGKCVGVEISVGKLELSSSADGNSVYSVDVRVIV